MATIIPYSDVEIQRKRLRQVLQWLIAAAAIVSLAQGSALLLISPVPLLAWTSFSVQFAQTGCFVVAWFLLAQNRIRPSIILVNVALLLSTIFFALIVPNSLPSLILIPLLVIAFSIPYLQTRDVRSLSIFVWFITLGVLVSALYEPPFAIQPSQEPPGVYIYNFVLLVSVGAVLALILLLLWQFYQRTVESVAQAQATNESLQEAQKGLEQQVAISTAELQAALRSVEQQAAEQAHLLQEIEQQRTVTRNLSIPILPVNDSMLVVPLIGDLDDKRMEDGQAKTLKAIEQTRARVLILDITGVPFIDSYIAQSLIRMIRAAQLLGAKVTVVGIRPEVAQAIIGLGLPLNDMRTASDLQSALAMNNHTKTEE
ncbi:MAG: STAS domain-containing protein [Chloroflexota bacterium]